MALNAEVSFTWLGHGTWRIRSAKWKDVLIDPWVMNNPVTPEKIFEAFMDLSTIHHGINKRTPKKRVGRGPGSGHGKTSSRG